MSRNDTNLLIEAYGKVLFPESSDEFETDFTNQDKVVNTLTDLGFVATSEEDDTVFLSYRPNRYTTLHTEVDREGLVNGGSIEDYIAHNDFPNKVGYNEFDDNKDVEYDEPYHAQGEL